VPCPVRIRAVIPLEHSWSFWFDKYIGPGLSAAEYEASMKVLGTVSTVQQFWQWFNNLPAAHDLGPRCSYHMMKQNIRPLWEDPANVNGGNLSFKVPKEDTDHSWLRLLLGVIGEYFSPCLKEEDDICGVTVSIRPRGDNVVCLWNANASLINTEELTSRLRILLPTVSIESPVYKVHKDELGSSAVKS